MGALSPLSEIMPTVKVPRADLEYNSRKCNTMKHLRSILRIFLITIAAAGAVVLVVFLSSRGSGTGEARDTYHSPTVFAMDTSLDITIQGRGKAEAQADSRAAAAVARQVESHTSRFVKDSDVSLINANAGVAPVKVHDDTMYLVKKSLSMRASRGEPSI